MFRKSGKYIFGFFIITPFVIWILGVIFAGNDAFALDFDLTGYDNVYAIQRPSVILRSGSHNGNMVSCGAYIDEVYLASQGAYFSIPTTQTCYPTSADDFTFHHNDLVVIQLTGPKGFWSSWSTYGIFDGDTGMFLGLTNSSLGEDSIVDLYYLITNNSTFNSRFEFHIHTSAISNPNIFVAQSISVWRPKSESNYTANLSAIETEVSGCNANSACEQQVLKKWVYDIYGVSSTISTTVSTISTNVSDIETILNDLGSDMSDLVDNSDETLQTNKNEKSNIENQTPQGSGFDISNQNTTNIIGAFQIFASGFSNLTYNGSCVIVGDLGNWDGVNVNMGNLDLCSLPVPVYVSTGLSLVLILILIGLVWWSINLILSLWRYVQGD